MAGDAFDLLELRAAFDLSQSEVEQSYLRLATSIHPDLAAGNEDSARRMAEINQARAIVRDPESRANALLVRLGGPAADQEKSLPPGFLAEMMDVRERLELSLGGEDAVARREQAQAWAQWAERQRQRAVEEVGGMFAGLPELPADRAAALRAIRVRLNAWRYVERLIEQLPAGSDR